MESQSNNLNAHDEIQVKWHGLLFDVQRSVRYHNRRRAFFDRLDQGSNMLSVMLGSTAIYGVLEQRWQVLTLSAVGLVTAFSAINLVLGSSQKARQHFDLARRFIELEKAIRLATPTPMTLAEFTQLRLSIEMDEPPVLRVLDAICYNEQARSEGYPDKNLAGIGWWQRQVAQIMDWRADKMTPPSAN